jgi:pimeloyl-ACP methyl ester carboxylesterase
MWPSFLQARDFAIAGLLVLSLPGISHARRSWRLEISPPVSRFIVEMLARALPHAQMRTVAGARHGLHVTHPTEHAETVMSFIHTFVSGRP